MVARHIVLATLLCLACTPAIAEQRLVFIEDFTNINCPPCDAIQDSMDAIFLNYVAQGKIAPLRYHVWWPDPNDPMYNWPTATQDIIDRVNFYGVSYVPTFRYDGRVRVDPSDFGTYDEYYAAVWQTIDSLYAVPSPVRIRITQNNRIGDSVFVGFDVVAADTSGGGLGTNQSLYLIVEEENQNWLGKKERFLFRDFLPGSSGYPLTLAVNDSLHFDWSYPTSTVLNPLKLATYIIVQRANQKVLQAARRLVPDPTDVTPGAAAIRFALEQNKPNPFNPLTTIPFHIERAGVVRLSIYDASGRHVRDLVNGPKGAGDHSEVWDGEDAAGVPVSSGVYYYRLESGKASETRKMTLLR